jgi:hypothetical protein
MEMNDPATPTTPQTAPAAEELERSLLADLLESSKLYHSTEDYLALMAFVSKLRNFAPFNALLLQIQKPGLAYAASEYDWRTRFNRTIKPHARPLLILWPFGPVALVYDVQDTEGDPLPEDVTQTFHATGPMDEDALDAAIKAVRKYGVYVTAVDLGDQWAGEIKIERRSTDKKERPDYRVAINQNHEVNVRFVTLVHELGHLFLGHLGPDKYLRIEQRPRPKPNIEELEAESLAYLVCKRRGIASKSESYLAEFAKPDTTIDSLDLYQLTKAAGQVEVALDIAAHTLFEPRKKDALPPSGLKG